MDNTIGNNTLRLENINIENASITCTVSRKCNLGNYESIELFAALKMPIKPDSTKEERESVYSEYFKELETSINSHISTIAKQPEQPEGFKVASKPSPTNMFEPEKPITTTKTTQSKPESTYTSYTPQQAKPKYPVTESSQPKQISDKQKKLILDLIDQKKPEKYSNLNKAELEEKVSNLSTKEASLLIGELYKS